MSIKIAQENSSKMNKNRAVSLAALVCVVTILHTGCSFDRCSNNCHRARGVSFGTHQARMVRSDHCDGCDRCGCDTRCDAQPVSTPVPTATPVTPESAAAPQPAANQPAANPLSFNDGIMAGYNYAKRFGITSPLTSNHELPQVLTDAAYGIEFENGCRQGINRAVNEHIVQQSKQIPKFINPQRDNPNYVKPREIQQPIDAPAPGPIATPEATPAATTSSPINTINDFDNNTSSFVPEPVSQPVYTRPTESALQNQGSIGDQNDQFEAPMYAVPTPEITKEPVSEPVEPEMTELAPLEEQPRETAETAESTDPAMDDSIFSDAEIDNRIDALFDRSHQIDNSAPQVDWQPADAETESDTTDTVPTDVTEVTDTEESEQPFADSTGVATESTSTATTVEPESSFKPYVAPKNNLKDIIKENTLIEPPSKQLISQESISMDAINQPAINSQSKIKVDPSKIDLGKPLPSAKKESKDDLILSAEVMPFRSRPANQSAMDGKMERLTEPQTKKTTNSIPRLKAIQNNRINKQVPRFKPSSKPMPAAETKTEPKQRPGVLINKMKTQKIDLDPITKLNATPNSGLNSNLKPNSNSRAIYQQIKTKSNISGGIKSEKADIFFVPPSSTKN